MHPRTSEHNMEVQFDHKCHYFCCTTEKHPNGMSRLCLDEQQLPSYDDFYTKLKNSNPLDKDYDGFQKLLKTGLTDEQALKKLGLKTKPLTGLEKYNYLKSIWEQEQMSTFRDFLRWYNNKDVVPTLDAM